MPRYEIEVEITRTGSVQIEADEHHEAIDEVHDMDVAELEALLTNVDVKHGGVYDLAEK